MKNFYLRLLVFLLLVSFQPIYSKENALQEVLPGDKPIVIELPKVNSYLVEIEAYNYEITQKINNGADMKSLSSTLNEINKFKKRFDNHIEHLDQKYSDVNLADFGYSKEQIKSIISYSYTEEERIALAATYSGNFTVFSNYYNSTSSRSEVYYAFNSTVSGLLLSQPTVATGIRTSLPGSFIKQFATMSARYEYSDGSAVYSNGTDYSSFKGGINLLPIHASGAGLKNFSYYYKGYAQGNHRVISLLGSVAARTWGVNAVSLGFSEDGPSLSIELKPKSQYKIDVNVPINR